MLTLSTRNQTIIGASLVLLLVITRGHHFATLHSLPGASWAVFFLAGVMLRPKWILPALLALAWVLDFFAFTTTEVSRFCLTPAYLLLLPAYAALWFAGRWYAARHQDSWMTLPMLVIAASGGALVCELFSSGGFYFFSGRFAEPTLVEFSARVVKYFPSYLGSLLFYVGTAVVIYAVVRMQHDVIAARSNKN